MSPHTCSRHGEATSISLHCIFINFDSPVIWNQAPGWKGEQIRCSSKCGRCDEHTETQTLYRSGSSTTDKFCKLCPLRCEPEWRSYCLVPLIRRWLYFPVFILCPPCLITQVHFSDCIFLPTFHACCFCTLSLPDCSACKASSRTGNAKFNFLCDN